MELSTQGGNSIMATKLKRKYDTLTKFLQETIANEKISHRVRMSAAERLDGIYSKHRFYEEKAAARKERTELRAQGMKAGFSLPPVEETPRLGRTPDAQRCA
jgi:hypothetical protein